MPCNLQKLKITTLADEDRIDKQTCCAKQKTNKIGLNTLVTKLPESHKELVYLAYYSRHTMEEISVNLNMPESIVKTRLRSAINILRKEFE